MRLKKLFVLVIATSSLAGCASFPDGRFCSLVLKKVFKEDGVTLDVPASLEKSYGYCVMYRNTADFKRIPAIEMFQEKYVAVSPDYYTDILAWVDKTSKKVSKMLTNRQM